MSQPPSGAPVEHLMQCMEVWGGNQPTDSGVVMPGLDAWVYSRPLGDTAGGDVHYVSSCATGRITRVLLADVAGHGEGVAGIAIKLRALMRRYVNYMEQTRFIAALNREFTDLSESGCFATAVAATFWAPTGYLALCNAGHPRPLLYRAKEGRWRAVDPSAGSSTPGLANIPLGIAPAAYDQTGLRLRRGDLVLFYTDAVIEAQAPDGSRLGEAGLVSMVASIGAADPAGLVPALLARLSEFRAGKEPDDDTTLLLLRPNDLRPRRTIADHARMFAGFARALAASMRRGGEAFPWPQMRADNILGAFVGSVNRRFGARASDE